MQLFGLDSETLHPIITALVTEYKDVLSKDEFIAFMIESEKIGKRARDIKRPKSRKSQNNSYVDDLARNNVQEELNLGPFPPFINQEGIFFYNI